MLNIFNLTEKLQQCNTYIARLEEQNEALRQKAELQQKVRSTDSASRYEQRKEAYLRPIREMTAYVGSAYEFRHNVVRDSYEMRRRDDDAAEWLPVDERQLNTIMNQVQDEGRVFCLKSLVTQRIRSEMAYDYHPVADYLSQVRGTWDGNNRLDALACRISRSDYCRRMVPVWLRSMVAQWLSIDDCHANAVMLLLISPRQGLHKSTFLHQLLPDSLSQYYTDDYSLTSKSNAERKLVEFAIINIDEFDKLPPKKMPELKTLMQTLRPSFVKAYRTNFNLLPRIASFVGTSNERHVLTDRTGSRRFLILEPDDIIDIDGIDHDQLYAQLVHEVEAGARSYFTKDEEAEMQRVNQPYYRLTPIEQLFRQFFRRPEPDEDFQSLSAAQLMEMLRRHAPSLLRQESVTSFGRMLTRLAIPRDHQHLGNTYRVVAL